MFTAIMKPLKLIPLTMTILAIFIRMDTPVSAFHDGGVGPCEACHTMHGSDGVPAGAYLLKAQNQSSTCLNCHERAGDLIPTRFHVSTPGSEMPEGFPPRQLTPGGDFGWLKKTYTWIPGAGQLPQYSFGERHGHNIIAPEFSYQQDGTNIQAPGGVYPGASLTCISCHDPHGSYRRNMDGSVSASGSPIRGSGSRAGSSPPDSTLSVGVYRLLGGKNYQPKSLSGNYGFINDPPVAVAPDVYNRSEALTQTRVAYGSGMSEWCLNCHPNMHTPFFPGRANLIHPNGAAAKLSVTKANYYNTYVKTGDLSGTQAASYLSLVPFEEGTSDYAMLGTHAKTDDSYLQGPDSVSSQVMCLTCHRAHASGWDGAARWNTKTSFLVSNGFYSQEGQAYQPYGQGRTESEAGRAYYDMPASSFAVNQDSLCNKCHGGVYP